MFCTNSIILLYPKIVNVSSSHWSLLFHRPPMRKINFPAYYITKFLFFFFLLTHYPAEIILFITVQLVHLLLWIPVVYVGLSLKICTRLQLWCFCFFNKLIGILLLNNVRGNHFFFFLVSYLNYNCPLTTIRGGIEKNGWREVMID